MEEGVNRGADEDDAIMEFAGLPDSDDELLAGIVEDLVVEDETERVQEQEQERDNGRQGRDDPRSGWSEHFTGVSEVQQFTLGEGYDGLPYGPRIVGDSPTESEMKSPLWWFQKFWTNEMTDVVVAQTNLYAFQQLAAASDLRQHRSSRPFVSIDHKEFTSFLCCLVALGLPAQTNFKKAFQERTILDIVKEAITLNRFEQILRYLHCADNYKDNKSDPLFKIRTLLKMVNINCKTSWIVSPICAIDEMDIGWRGMHKHKERITYKKAGDGFLIYALCDEGGYVFNFVVKFDTTWQRDIDGLCPTFSALLHLVDEMRSIFPDYKHGEIYADNLYSSIPLVQSLLQRSVYYCGTLRKSRVPKKFVLEKDDAVGTIKQLHKGDITVVLWRPKAEKEVRMITSVHRPVKESVTVRRRPSYDPVRGHYIRRSINVTVPDCAEDYNLYMNAVDIADQLRSYYTTRRRTNKWWHRFFFFVLDTALCNAYVSYKRYMNIENERRLENGGTALQVMSHRNFNVLLAEELLKASSGSGRKRKHLSSSSGSYSSSNEKRMLAKKARNDSGELPLGEEVRSFVALHTLEKVTHSNSNDRLCRICVECMRVKKERKRTVYYCTDCDVGLHPECFAPHHLIQGRKN